MAIREGDGTIAAATTLAADGTKDHAAAGAVPAVLVLAGNVIAAPRVSSAIALNAFSVRVTFDQPMTKNSQLSSQFNYQITPSGGGVPVFISSVTPENVAFPTYVDLAITEMTGGEGYVVRVESGLSSPVSRFSQPINPLGNTQSYVGIGENPTLVRAVSVSENLVDVIFSENMLDNAAIRDPSRYTFDNGLSVTAVLSVDGDTVRLVTTNQTPGLPYTLTIT